MLRLPGWCRPQSTPLPSLRSFRPGPTHGHTSPPKVSPSMSRPQFHCTITQRLMWKEVNQWPLLLKVAKLLNKLGQHYDKKNVICYFAMKWSTAARVHNVFIRKANYGLLLMHRQISRDSAGRGWRAPVLCFAAEELDSLPEERVYGPTHDRSYSDASER